MHPAIQHWLSTQRAAHGVTETGCRGEAAQEFYAYGTPDPFGRSPREIEEDERRAEAAERERARAKEEEEKRREEERKMVARARMEKKREEEAAQRARQEAEYAQEEKWADTAIEYIRQMPPRRQADGRLRVPSSQETKEMLAGSPSRLEVFAIVGSQVAGFMCPTSDLDVVVQIGQDKRETSRLTAACERIARAWADNWQGEVEILSKSPGCVFGFSYTPANFIGKCDLYEVDGDASAEIRRWGMCVLSGRRFVPREPVIGSTHSRLYRSFVWARDRGLDIPLSCDPRLLFVVDRNAEVGWPLGAKLVIPNLLAVQNDFYRHGVPLVAALSGEDWVRVALD